MGTGIYRVKARVKIPLSIGYIVKVSQSEVAAIEHCAEELLRKKNAHKTIASSGQFKIGHPQQGYKGSIPGYDRPRTLLWYCKSKHKDLQTQNMGASEMVRLMEGVPRNMTGKRVH